MNKKMIKININNKDYMVEEGKTILQIVQEMNIDDIPFLCHSDSLEHYTSCYLCVVELEGARNLVPSCATVARECMRIQTRNERVLKSRKANLELLLSNHYADCYPPCRLACPANVDIQGYIALTARGLYYEAQCLMKETNPLPMVCGRVCARPCEDSCRRNYVDEPVDIKNIKRFLADQFLESESWHVPQCGPDTGKKIAVIGSGPAGLTAAYFLRKQGHSVCIYEMMPEPGGMMRYGIPEYRLPKKDLQKEIDSILSMGIELRCGIKLGKDMSIATLFNEGYEAIFLGIGAWNGSSTGVEGEDLDGVRQGVDFLRDAALGNVKELSGRVFVIGGGNTAMDTARTALRLGAREVTVLYRRSEDEMPANPEEVKEAREEGVIFRFLSAPVAYKGEHGELTGVECVRMELGEIDASGRRRPVEVPGSNWIENADYVFEAVGQKVNPTGLDGIELSRRGTITVDEDLFTTGIKGVFAGGDAVSGPYIIIGAVAEGRKAAHVINQYLSGSELARENLLGFHVKKEDFGVPDQKDFNDQEKVPRNKMSKADPDIRKKNFKEVELGFTEGEAVNEANRCMECGCQDIYECKLKKYADEYEAITGIYKSGKYRNSDYKTGHEYIEENLNKCINCGRCVRVCSEHAKQSVFAVDGRGFDSVPVPCNYTGLLSTTCTSCGLCVAYCPAGALVEKIPGEKPGPFKNAQVETYCVLCGDACKLVIESRQGNYVKTGSKKGTDEFFDNLCSRGRFEYPSEIEWRMDQDEAEIRDRARQVFDGIDPSRILMCAGTGLTVEEIEKLHHWTKNHSADIISFEQLPDKERFLILQDAGLPLCGTASDGKREYSHIYLFGEFTEKYNSVSFRDIIHKDMDKEIFLSGSCSASYFKHHVCKNDDECLDSLQENRDRTVLVAVQMQTISVSTLKKLAVMVKNGKSMDLMVLNSYANHQKLSDINAGSSEVETRMASNYYKACLSVNSKDFPYAGVNFPVLELSDVQRSNPQRHVKLKPFYAREGTVIDQKGILKKIYPGCDAHGITPGEFLDILEDII